MYIKHTIGQNGEDEASDYLRNYGYKIIERNFLCRQGEIDIVAFDKETNEYVFIEVKTRNNKKYGEPSESINRYKQKHIFKSAQYYIYKNSIENQFIRFDAIIVFKKHLIHYKNCDFKI